MANKIILPKVYEINENTPEKYHVHAGKPKISYSQKTSWLDPQYHGNYIKQYFSGVPSVDNIFNVFGSEVGEFIEAVANGEKSKSDTIYLEDEDRSILLGLDYPSKSVYEDEIVIDRGDYVIQGFTDRTQYFDDGGVGIRDYKTGNVDTKAKFYASEEYGQTTLYMYQKEVEGFIPKYSHVMLLGRKGNNMMYKSGLSRVRLSGDNKIIDTPYSKERAEKLLLSFDKAVQEISETYKTYLKVFG